MLKRCIYGVDLNRMAVELAKLSLWLHSFTVGAPLSFLDHHLRWGNSLIGADVRTVEAAIAATDSGQMALWGGPFAGLLDLTTAMLEIAGRADATLADVRRSADEFDAMQAALTPYKQALDLWVSQYFGNPAAKELLTVHGGDVLPALRGERELDERYRGAVAEARRLWEEKRFFHWDLEFPEVFVDLARRDWAENPGFDAVIGNPPWGGTIDMEMYGYLKDRFIDLHQRLPDTAKYFFGIATHYLNNRGSFGQILPNVVLYAHEYTRFRQVLLSRYSVDSLVNLGDNVFQQVTAPCCMITARRSETPSSGEVTVCDLRHFERDRLPSWKGENCAMIRQEVIRELPDAVVIANLDGMKLLTQLYTVSDKVVDLASSISLGVHTGCNDAFVITPSTAESNQIEKDILWALLTGSDIDRYFTSEHPPQLIMFAEWDFDAESHPKTIEYLANFKEQLAARREARQRKMPWYALHWPRYRDLYSSPKIMCRQTADTLIATVDPFGHCALNSTIIIRPDSAEWSPYFWVSLLNSRLIRFVYGLLAQEEQRTFAEVKPVNLRKLPIHRIAFTTPAADRARYAEEGRRLYAQFSATGDPAPLLALVDAHLSPSQAAGARSDVVHDLLAYLAEQMIAMNKAKQAEVKGFLAWLSREIGAPIDAFEQQDRAAKLPGRLSKGRRSCHAGGSAGSVAPEPAQAGS